MNEEFLKAIACYPEYLQKKIIKLISEYQTKIDEAEKVTFDKCPKCGHLHPVIIKGGKTKAGKQMYRCKHCGKRFTEDHGTLTYYSQQSKEAWKDFIKLTLDKRTLKEIGGELGVTLRTAFNMRHKFMVALEDFSDLNEVSDIVELDETYVLNSLKGKKKLKGRKARERGEKATKRGLSNEQVCLITGVDRKSNASAMACNSGKPKAEDVLAFSSHIGKGSYILTDGLATYSILETERNCSRTVLVGTSSYNKLENLNTVNSFHRMIKRWYSDMDGVASKYINRYANLFSIKWITKGMSFQEALFYIQAKIKMNNSGYIRISEISSKNIFTKMAIAG